MILVKTRTQKIVFFFVSGLCAVLFTTTTTYAACVYDGDNFHISGSPDEVVSPIHRLYNTRTGVHLYTRGVTDANKVLGKWADFEFTDGRPAFCASLTKKTGLTPIYRLYNTKTGVHLYTRGTADRDGVLKKWPVFEFTDGGPAFYASLSPKTGLTPIYRLYNTKTGVHLYTRGTADRDGVLKKWPVFEFTDGGAAFYADLALDTGPTLERYAGPSMSVGLHAYTRDELSDEAFKIDANRSYVIKDSAGTRIATVSGSTTTRVTYDGNKKLKIYNSIPEKIVDRDVYFEAADGNNTSMVFDVHKPGSNYDEYRGKINLHYAEYEDPNTQNDVKRIWVINTLPLEHYIWGDGELRGTGDMDHNRVMVTAFRTYGYFWIRHATKWNRAGFILNATPGNQIYYGYGHEVNYPRVKAAAQDTRGIIVTSKDSDFDNDVAITPYSSWTDGRTRSFKERWGSSSYPWCASVSDPYGEHPTKSTSTLVAEGNHMVGLSANGSLTLAGDKGWDWKRIMKYYFTDVSLTAIY